MVSAEKTSKEKMHRVKVFESKNGQKSQALKNINIKPGRKTWRKENAITE